MIDNDKRAARRIARSRSVTHQTALDEISVGTAVAEAIIDPDDGSMYGNMRLLLCLFVRRICPTNGTPSILAMTHEITRYFLPPRRRR